MSDYPYTVHFDDGSKPVFEHYKSHEDAVDRVAQVAAELGRFAIILEDN